MSENTYFLLFGHSPGESPHLPVHHNASWTAEPTNHNELLVTDLQATRCPAIQVRNAPSLPDGRMYMGEENQVNIT